MQRCVPVLLALIILAACGTDTPTTTDPAATTTTTVEAASTTAPPATTEAPSTTGTPTTEAPPPAEWSVPGFPEAFPPEAIPWEEIGAGWLLIRYRQAVEDWQSPQVEALFLVDPEGAAYAVSMWVRPEVEILAWSPEGKRILTFDGTLKVLHLADGSETVVPVDLPSGEGYHVSARFTRPTGRDIVIRVLDWEDHATLECRRTDGTLFSRFADFDLTALEYADPDFVPFGISWLYAATGTEVVIATSDGIRLIDNQGATIRRLATPGLGCTLSRWWDDDSMLVSCYDRDWAASPCWYTGPGPGGRSLWAVPLDGSAATRLTPTPVCAPEAWEPDYFDALAAGGVIAAETGGCCECGGSLTFFATGEAVVWGGGGDASGPGGSPACSPDLVTVSPAGTFVILDTVMGWDDLHGATGYLPTLFAVAPNGSTLGALTPLLPGLYGGVTQVFTTAEASD